MNDLLRTFLDIIPLSYATIFGILNPLGSAIIILMLTKGVDYPTYKKLCQKIAVNVFVLLFLVIVCGSWVLRFFGITIPIVQIGGGLVVSRIAWNVLNQNAADDDSKDIKRPAPSKVLSMAFFPLTMPITAGPGTIATVLTLSADNSYKSWPLTLASQAGLLFAIILMSLTVYFCFLFAEPVTDKAGQTATNVIMRLSAFISLCIGISIVWHGIEGLLQL